MSLPAEFLTRGYFNHSINLKFQIIRFIFFVYIIESIEDCFWGEWQRYGRIDLGAKLFIVRWGSLLILFYICVLLLRQFILSFCIAVVGSIVCFGLVLYFIIRNNPVMVDIHKETFLKSFKILKESFPLFAFAFLSFYLNTLPKYYIDSCYNDETKTAVFSFISMPVFAVGLFSSFVYQPKIIWLTYLWQEDKKKEFRGAVIKQCLYILLLTFFCFAVAFFWGTPFLSVLFATDLAHYKNDLLLLIIAGGMLALISYVGVLYTIIRKQKELLIGYIITSFIACFIFPYNIKRNEIHGATVGTLFIFSGQALLFYLGLIRDAKRKFIRGRDDKNK